MRILCKNCLEKRKNGIPVQQYTIRIAPDFLGPYTRRTVSQIFNAICGYIKGVYQTTIEAALEMGCENEKSFIKYLIRAKYRFQFWLKNTLNSYIKAGGYSDPDLTISKQRKINPDCYLWQRWEVICSQLIEIYEKLDSQSKYLNGIYQVQEMIIGRHNPWKGLGPAPPKSG